MAAVENAKRLYESLSVGRQAVLEAARRCSELTIPSLLPPEGSNNTTRLESAYQSLGAYGVNNLAAKLLLALYPPGTAFFRLVLPESIAAEAGELGQEERAEMEKRLASIENRVIQRFESSSIRPQKAEELVHLIVAGNVLTKFESMDNFRLFRLDQYVCCRDAAGNPLDVVVKECISARSLTPEVRDAVGVKEDRKEAVEVYTHVKWERQRCSWHQEINGITVPGSNGESTRELCPWNPLRWKAVPGSDYGRGHCEEYLGDLTSLEGLSQSCVEFAAIAAKILFLVHPGSVTDIKEVNRAMSGDAVSGRKDDIDVLQLDKYADFQVVNTVAQRIEERLSRAFLLRSGLVRDAERVTAEEIRGTAQELEDTLGGVYTVLANEEQMPFVRRMLHVEQRAGEIPTLPKGTVEPVVVTGFQALGRNHSLNKLRGALADLANIFGPEGLLKLLNSSSIATEVFLGWGVENAAGKVKSAEQLQAEAAQEQQMAMLQQLVEKGVGPAINASAKQS